MPILGMENKGKGVELLKIGGKAKAQDSKQGPLRLRLVSLDNRGSSTDLEFRLIRVCCVTDFAWGDETHRSIHQRNGAQDRPK